MTQHPLAIDGVIHASHCRCLSTPAGHVQRRPCSCGSVRTYRVDFREAELRVMAWCDAQGEAQVPCPLLDGG